MMCRLMQLALPGAVFALQCGCGKSEWTTVRGTVTCNGKILEKGYITFFPAEGAETSRGGPIANGEFEVADVTPGRKRVYVTATPEVNVRKHAKGDLLQIQKPHARITPHTAGNNQVVEIRSGSNALTIALGP